MTATIITLAKWEEIHAYANRSGWIFRGHREAKWDLTTSIERCCERHDVPHSDRRAVEERTFREFRRIYYQYVLHIPSQQAVVEWLALMQHHGAPNLHSAGHELPM